jgi:signal transduction histidine kinase
LGDVLRKAFEQLRGLFHDARLFVLTYNAAERVLEFQPESRDFYPIDAKTFSKMRRVPIDGPSISSEVARQALHSHRVEVINTPDVRHRLSYLKLISSTRSKLVISLMHGDQLLGVLGLESDRPDAFSHDDVILIRLVSQQISLAIDRANQNAQLYFTTSVAVRTLWAAEIAHDINSEVGHMRLVLDRLKRMPGTTERGQHLLDTVDQRAARMAHILDSVRHEQQFRGDRLPLHEWLAQVIGSVELEGIEVVYDTTDLELCVRAQPLVLQRVLLHLLRNAREAMKGRSDACLTVRTRAVGHMVELQLQNNGASIPEEVRRKLLQEPFTTKRQPGGLGLVFVRMMVEEMGGSVRLLPDEPLGGGAVFELALPMA